MIASPDASIGSAEHSCDRHFHVPDGAGGMLCSYSVVRVVVVWSGAVFASGRASRVHDFLATGPRCNPIAPPSFKRLGILQYIFDENAMDPSGASKNPWC